MPGYRGYGATAGGVDICRARDAKLLEGPGTGQGVAERDCGQGAYRIVAQAQAQPGGLSLRQGKRTLAIKGLVEYQHRLRGGGHLVRRAPVTGAGQTANTYRVGRYPVGRIARAVRACHYREADGALPRRGHAAARGHGGNGKQQVAVTLHPAIEAERAAGRRQLRRKTGAGQQGSAILQGIGHRHPGQGGIREILDRDLVAHRVAGRGCCRCGGLEHAQAVRHDHGRRAGLADNTRLAGYHDRALQYLVGIGGGLIACRRHTGKRHRDGAVTVGRYGEVADFESRAVRRCRAARAIEQRNRGSGQLTTVCQRDGSGCGDTQPGHIAAVHTDRVIPEAGDGKCRTAGIGEGYAERAGRSAGYDSRCKHLAHGQRRARSDVGYRVAGGPQALVAGKAHRGDAVCHRDIVIAAGVARLHRHIDAATGQRRQVETRDPDARGGPPGQRHDGTLARDAAAGGRRPGGLNDGAGGPAGRHRVGKPDIRQADIAVRILHGDTQDFGSTPECHHLATDHGFRPGRARNRAQGNGLGSAGGIETLVRTDLSRIERVGQGGAGTGDGISGDGYVQVTLPRTRHVFIEYRHREVGQGNTGLANCGHQRTTAAARPADGSGATYQQAGGAARQRLGKVDVCERLNRGVIAQGNTQAGRLAGIDRVRVGRCGAGVDGDVEIRVLRRLRKRAVGENTRAKHRENDRAGELSAPASMIDCQAPIPGLHINYLCS